MGKSFSLKLLSWVCVGVALMVCQVEAGFVTYNMDTEFSGATAPEGVGPWLTATFDDQGTPGTVILTLNTAGLTDNEFVSGFYFNFDPSLNISLLSASINSSPAVTTISPFITNKYKADGDGLYDGLISFSNGALVNGVTATFTLSSSEAITFESFAFESAPAGGHGPFFVAAHVQGIGPTDADSGWITGTTSADQNQVPEPTSMILFGLGGLGAIAAGRRRRQQAA